MVFFHFRDFRLGLYDRSRYFRFGRRGRSLGLFTDDGNRLTDRHCRALFDQYRMQHAGGVGLELHDRLVRFDLSHRFSQLNVGAFGLQPPHYGAFLHVVAHLGHGEFSSQGTPPLLNM